VRGSHGWSEISEERKREVIAGIASGKATRGPVHAELDVTDRCNVACYFCNQIDVRTKEQISLEHVRAIIDDLAAGGLKSVRLSGGGDPLMHRQIVEIFDHLASRNVVVDNLTTNGALLSPVIADRLVDDRAREVVFSLNAADASDYHRMLQVKPETFDRVVENIRRLVERRGAGNHPAVVVQFLLDRVNLADIPRMYRLGRSLGVDRVSIGLVLEIPNERIDSSLLLRPPDAELLRHPLEEALAADRDARMLQIDFPYPAWNAMLGEIKGMVGYEPGPALFSTASSFQENNGHCFFGWYTATIRGNGDMYPCCLLMSPDYKPLGNAINGRFTDHWNGPAFSRMRREMRDVFLTPKIQYTPERFQILRRQCVEPGMCFLKNMYFRGDETFYRELGEALNEVRHRERWKIRFRESTEFLRRKSRGLKRRVRRLFSRARPAA
jgi:MoaA/NifB/PqqE/SkfB family radical SAM enzyme